MCIRDSDEVVRGLAPQVQQKGLELAIRVSPDVPSTPVSYTHLRAHETVLDIVCRLLLEKKKKRHITTIINH